MVHCIEGWISIISSLFIVLDGFESHLVIVTQDSNPGGEIMSRVCPLGYSESSLLAIPRMPKGQTRDMILTQHLRSKFTSFALALALRKYLVALGGSGTITITAVDVQCGGSGGSGGSGGLGGREGVKI